MSKKGLGRGLQALLSDDIGDELSIKEIPISTIDPNPEQPRREFDELSLNELADSLRVHGLLQPILVRPIGDRYFLIAGERRLRAAKIAGFSTIQCIVQQCSDQEMAERALIENIQRSDLSPIDEGLAYDKLIREYGLSQEQVAQRVGKARSTVTNLLRIIQLPNSILDLLRNNSLSLGHAKVLLGVKDTSLQVITAQKAAKEQLSVRETENLISRLSETTDKVRPSRDVNPVLNQVQDQLRTYFQTKVNIKGDTRRGSIEVQFFSQDELNRLLELWNIRIE